MFDEAGLDYPTRDWDQQTFLEAAQALTKREDGRVVQYGFADAPLNMWYWIWQNGGEVFDNDTNPSVMLLNEPAALESVKWYFDLSLVHGVAPTLPELMQSGGQQELFAGGRVAMLADLRGATQVLNQITDFEWGMTELPRGKEGRATVFNWAGYSITAGSAHPEEAWEFLKWIAGPEGVPIFIEGGNSLPALWHMVGDPSLGVQQPFIDSIPYARPFFASPKWSDLLPAMLQYLQLMAVGQMSVEEAVPAMKAAVDPILAP
jgi:multiple sugar transport system substrate-binding protein